MGAPFSESSVCACPLICIFACTLQEFMAESGQGGLDVSAGQPSIFEVIAQDSFASSIQPAVRHLVKVRISLTS